MVFMRKGGGKKVAGGGKSKGRATTTTTTSGAKGAKGASSASGRNPFDVRGNTRSKFEVIGRRVKGQGRNVAEARAAAEAKRHKTLGAQFQARHKANAFRDRRLGEQDASMSLEDKMMARFQTERKRKMRNASAFALHDSDDDGDGDGDDLFLTHRGARIDDYDRLNDDGALEPDDDVDDDHSREMDREIVNKLHFGGGANGSTAAMTDGKKSHKEIMQEVMLKSKMYKAERQKNKSAQDESTENLDDGFNDIRALLEFRPTRANGKELPDKGPLDEFDKLTREFAFEAKAKATERRLSPEEAAQRERDRLAELEKKRVARMAGDDDDSDDSDSGGKKRGKKKQKKKSGKKDKTPQLILMPPTDDDLSSDYALDPRFSGAEQNETDDNDDEKEDEEAGDIEDDNDDEEEEEEDDDSEAESGDDENDDDENNDDESETAEKADSDDDDDDDDDSAEDKKRRRQEAADELPFVFPCPESPDDLTALFKQHAKGSAASRALIVERVITYYSPRLSAENQGRMKSFFAILVRQFLKWAAHYAIHRDDVRVA